MCFIPTGMNASSPYAPSNGGGGGGGRIGVGFLSQAHTHTYACVKCTPRGWGTLTPRLWGVRTCALRAQQRNQPGIDWEIETDAHAGWRRWLPNVQLSWLNQVTVFRQFNLDMNWRFSLSVLVRWLTYLHPTQLSPSSWSHCGPVWLVAFSKHARYSWLNFVIAILCYGGVPPLTNLRINTTRAF